jgi:DMSO/TMAO reductase YedYZ heme-binding membrane subunit
MLGVVSLMLAAIASAFVKEIYKVTHRPFKRVHHILAISGTILITLHPLLFAWQMKSLNVFIPIVSSWSAFLSWGGRVGIILIYLAALAALMMKKIPSWWRQGHWLVYLGLLLGGVHALRMGQDLMTPALKTVGFILLGLIGFVFFYKRWHRPVAAPAKPPPPESLASE